MALQLQSALGLALLIFVGWLLSERRGRPPWRMMAIALLLQGAIAAVLLHLPAARVALGSLNRLVLGLQEATLAGTSFVFGYVGGGGTPFDTVHPAQTFILAFQALPLLIVVSALSALLWHWRILPVIIRAIAWALGRAMGVSGATSLATAANVFVGMLEAPLLIRPVLGALSRADLFLLMTTGLATIGGTMMVLEASVLARAIPDALGHILVASMISLPASVLFARVMIPGDEGPPSTADTRSPYASAMDAVVQGTEQGLSLFLRIIAILIVAVAFVALADSLIALAPAVGGAPLSLERLLGCLFTPLALALGVPWEQAGTAATLLGKRVVLNELLAYLDLAALPDGTLDLRVRLILVYALSGFANFGSLGILLGGLTALIPERRLEILALGWRSLVAGLLATAMTGAVIGLLLSP